MEKVRADTARLTLTDSQINSLPPLAVFSQRNGRAQLKIVRKGDSISITGSCDSLQVLVEYYHALSSSAERRVAELSDSLEVEKKRSEKQSHSPNLLFKGKLLAILTAMTVGVYLTMKLKKRIWQ